MSTTARNIPANGFRTRQRLLASGVSETMLVARTGLGPSYFRSLLNRNEINTSATLADIRKMLAMLGMTWGDLLDPTPYGPQEDPATATDDDPATLLLLRERRFPRHANPKPSPPRPHPNPQQRRTRLDPRPPRSWSRRVEAASTVPS